MNELGYFSACEVEGEERGRGFAVDHHGYYKRFIVKEADKGIFLSFVDGG